MRIGIIENLPNISVYAGQNFAGASAEKVMSAVGGNTGNIAFVHGAHQIIGNPLVRMGWGSAIPKIREDIEHVVICCANQIGAHVDLKGWADYLEALNLPVTLLGLGAQSETKEVMPKVPDGSLRFLKVVSSLRRDNACNIGVRGTFTQSVLASLGVESTILGCPSLFGSEVKNLGQTLLARQRERGKRGIAVAAGNPWHGRSANFERKLVDIVEKYQGRYILQHPLAMVQFAFGEKEQLAPNTVKRFLEVYGPRFDLDSLLDWYKQYAEVFTDVPTWASFLEKFDGVIGPRYHGVALAVQAGVPGCVVTMDARTQELAETTEIKRMDIAQAMKMEPDELVEAVWWSEEDANKFDKNRLNCAGVCKNFLMTNGIVPSRQLLQIAE